VRVLDLQNKALETALQLAHRIGNGELERLLREKGATKD
jgi:ankyrin repeat protein